MDTEARFQTLEEKIQQQDKKLIHQESKLRLHKRLGLIAAALLVGSAAFAAARPKPDTVEGKLFVLRDAEGRKRGIWGMADGDPQIALLDKNGERRVALLTGTSGSGLGVYDKNGKGRVLVGLMQHSLPRGDEPSLVFSSEKGDGGLMLIATKSRSLLQFLAPSDNIGAIFSWKKGAGGRLEFFDENEKTVWKAPIQVKKK